jgi:drug/metabolite transporter (DMT)-like permease
LDFLVGKRLLPKQIIGALLAVAGVGFLELSGASGNALESLNYGDLASLVQPLAFGMGFWRMENAMSLYPQHAARSTAAQMMAVFCAYAAYCAIACGVTHTVVLDFSQILAWVTTPSVLFSLFWTGVVTTAFTVYMETVALKTLSAAETTLIFSTEPIWGTVFASYIMGETLGLDAAMGAVLILSGCLFSNLGLDGLKTFTQQKQKPKVIDPALSEKPTPVLVRSGIAGAIGSFISNLGEGKGVAEVAAAAAEELERLDDVIQSVKDIL